MVKKKPRARVLSLQSQLQNKKYEGTFSSNVYYFFLTATWRKFLLSILALYFLANCAFASCYLLLGPVIENARPGSFADAFFFSVQTMATIGYGKLMPVGTAANLLVAIEALLGIVLSALMTGAVLARLTRPSSGVRFTKMAVVHNHDGVLTLKIRMANERDQSNVVEANARMLLIRDAVTLEGHHYRRAENLKLVRAENAVFTLSWTIMHQITPDSPLYRSPEQGGFSALLNEMSERKWFILVIFNGYQETFASEVHTRALYYPKDLHFDVDFADVLHLNGNGEVLLDLQYFDHLKTLDGEQYQPNIDESLQAIRIE